MSDEPTPETTAPLRTDDRGVSTTLGYTLTLSITAILIAGLLTAGGALIEDQRSAVVTDELTVTGQQLAGGLEDADRLAGTASSNGTVRVNVWLPEDVGSGGEYTLRLVNKSIDDGQPARATIVATAESVDVTRSISFRTEHAVANHTIPGGPVTIAVDDADGDGTRELEVREQGDIGVNSTEAAAFDRAEVVSVDSASGVT